MTDIERTLAVLIETITRNNKDIDYKSVIKAWREYLSFWPDLERASEYMQDKLIKKAIETDSENFWIIFGQYMENFRWSLNKNMQSSRKTQETV